MPKKDLDWLIETAENQLGDMLDELKLSHLEPRDRRAQRAVLIQLIASLQKLYIQAGVLVERNADSWKEALEKIPEASHKEEDLHMPKKIKERM